MKPELATLLIVCGLSTVGGYVVGTDDPLQIAPKLRADTGASSHSISLPRLGAGRAIDRWRVMCKQMLAINIEKDPGGMTAILKKMEMLPREEFLDELRGELNHLDEQDAMCGSLAPQYERILGLP